MRGVKGEWWGVRGLRHALDGLDLLLTLAVLFAKRHAHEHALGADLVARHAGDGEEELLCYSEKVLGPVVALAHLVRVRLRLRVRVRVRVRVGVKVRVRVRVRVKVGVRARVRVRARLRAGSELGLGSAWQTLGSLLALT